MRPPAREASHEQDPGQGGEEPAGKKDTVQGAGDSANETQRWLDGLHDVARAASQLPRKTRVISVMDREADFFELFDAQRRMGGIDVLVRAQHDRRLGEGVAKLFATLRNAPADGHVEIEIARVSERPKSSRKQARPARSARVARAEVHYRELILPSTVEGFEPVTLWAVHVREKRRARGRETGRVVPAHQRARRLPRGRPRDRRALPAALARGGLLSSAEVRMPGRTSRFPYRGTAPARDHHQYRHRVASDAHDPARARGAPVRCRAAVWRCRAAVPE